MIEMNVAQGVGLFAFLIGATAFLQKDGRKFRLHLMVFQLVLCKPNIVMSLFSNLEMSHIGIVGGIFRQL